MTLKLLRISWFIAMFCIFFAPWKLMLAGCMFLGIMLIVHGCRESCA